MDLVLNQRQRLVDLGQAPRKYQRPFSTPELEALSAGTDRRERIVDFVHHTGSKRSDRRELLRLRESVFCLPPFGDILTDRDYVGHVLTADAHRDLRDAI